ncbi:hypothetical protein E4U22_002714 [Claviceps purpurea]|nr:hypothetical protein E4U22_002714 [Claviceps purpurea]
MDHNWIQDSFEGEDLKRTVKTIHVCVYRNDENQGEGGSPPVNHWSIFFETSITHSVCMDIVVDLDATPDDLRGQIDVSTRTYGCTRKAIHRLSFPTKDPKDKPKVEDIVKLINRNGLHQYTFTPESEGCRFWVCTFMSHLENEGLVESGCVDQTWADAAYYYIDPSGRELRELKEGTFEVCDFCRERMRINALLPMLDIASSGREVTLETCKFEIPQEYFPSCASGISGFLSCFQVFDH